MLFPGIRLLDGAANIPISHHHDRSVSPGQTVARLKPHFQRLGITRLGELTGLDELGIPVAFAVRPNSYSLAISLGKGIDKDSALASAAMEAAEAATAEKLPSERIHASRHALERSGTPVLDLSRIARCLPERLDGDIAIDWVEGFDLISGQAIWIPWGLAGLDYRSVAPGFHDAFEISTDGLASGNVMAEAVLHGIYELIERDAHALLEMLPQEILSERRCELDPHESGELASLKQSIKRAGLSLHLLDMTTDIAVPAFMAVLAPSHVLDAADSAIFCTGCGCHVFPERAVMRALTEASQARVALVAGARDDFQSNSYRSIENLPLFSSWRKSSAPIRPLALPPYTNSTPPRAAIGEAIENVLKKLLAAGIEQVIVVKLDCGIPGISVVRVIIPDLQIPLHGTRTQISTRGLAQLVKFEP
jgi:YcaO-like protein with predicted kinase domain